MNGSPVTASQPDWVALAAEDRCDDDQAAGLLRELRRNAAIFPPPDDTGARRTDLKGLTAAMGRGDEAAFVQFYDRYHLRLYKYLLVLAGGNETEAREVLQTVVVKLARRSKVFAEERQMWSWLCRLARNAYVDLCRARCRDRRFVPLEDHKPELLELREGEHRLSESLNHALERLTAEERELMRAAYVDERPLQELANGLGQTYKAVESRLARLRQKVKTNLLNHLRHEERS